MTIAIWIVALVVLFFVASAWFLRHEEDDETIADFVPPPHGGPIETLIWPLVGETQLNDDHSSRQTALTKCTEGTPVEIKFTPGGPGGVDRADVLCERGGVGTLRKDAIDKLNKLRHHHQKTEAYIRNITGRTEEHAIRSATLQAYVYKD